ncbi:hypothetical protein [Halorussus pelagicus]|uniref:hypothetical protein n=1 Tax=Halorussus pelagicus TaxID=2505977 RepID=UPI000FFCBC60|nr:hypothetical protein [Halorussus pelagicus]
MVWNYISEKIKEDEQARKRATFGLVVSTAMLGIIAGFALTSTGVLRPDTLHGKDNLPEDELAIQGGYANVSANNSIDRVRLIVTKGSESVDFSGVSVTWHGVNVSTSLVSAPVEDIGSAKSSIKQSERFEVASVHDQDSSFPVLNEESDRFELVFHVDAIEGTPIKSGQIVTLEFTLPDRSIVAYTVELPTSLDGKSTVKV